MANRNDEAEHALLQAADSILTSSHRVAARRPLGAIAALFAAHALPCLGLGMVVIVPDLAIRCVLAVTWAVAEGLLICEAVYAQLRRPPPPFMGGLVLRSARRWYGAVNDAAVARRWARSRPEPPPTAIDLM